MDDYEQLLESASSEQLREIIAIQNEVIEAGIDLDRIIHLMVRRVQRLLNADGAVLEFLEGGEMVYTAASGLASNLLGLRISTENSLSGLCTRIRLPLVCKDSETDERVDRIACRKVGLRSMLVVPLYSAQRTIGVIKALSAQPDAFGDSDIGLLTIFGRIISTAIYNAERFTSNNLYLESTTDILTGVRNRRYFFDALRSFGDNAEDTGYSFTIFILDMDNLKTINDTQGHHHGDLAIHEMVSRIKSVLREDDILARLGGDEFGILAASMDSEDDAQAMTSRLSQAICVPFHAGDREFELSASIGFAICSGGFEDCQNALDLADKRMYENKVLRKSARVSSHKITHE